MKIDVEITHLTLDKIFRLMPPHAIAEMGNLAAITIKYAIKCWQ
jgi:hypothetical protein